MSLPASDQELLLLHNPRCSKSRQVKALLEERGLTFAERRYLDDPLDADELRDLATRLGRPIAKWTRRKEKAFAEAQLGPESGDEAWAAAMAAEPVLMERPILIAGQRARVGRPPEAVLELL